MMATKLFPAMSLLTCSRAIPANTSVIKGIQIPDEINTTWISAQLSKITSLSSETMVCPSEILQSNQSCSGQQGQIYWEASVLFPCLAEPPASASWGMQGCYTPALQLWLCCSFGLGNTYQKVMAKSYCGIFGNGWHGPSFFLQLAFSFPPFPRYL